MWPKSLQPSAVVFWVAIFSFNVHGQARSPQPPNSSVEALTKNRSPGLRKFNIDLPIPDGWKPPAAIIGNYVPKIQDKDRAVSPSINEVYLSPNHGVDGAELEVVLFEVSPKYIGAMVANPNGSVPIRGDAIIPYETPSSKDTVSELVEFGNSTAARFRISRFARSNIPTIEDLYYVACGGKLLRIQLRSLQPYFERYEKSVYSKYREVVRCPAEK